MNQTIKQQLTRRFSGGLIDKPLDGSEFSLNQFGALQIGKAPVIEFEVPRRPDVRDQGNTDFCTCFQGAYTIQQDTGELLSPAFLFAATKKRYYGGNYLGFGLGIKDMLGALQNDGICKENLYPFNNNRNQMANWKNISDTAWIDAASRKLKRGYFSVDIFKDKFDNFLAAMYNWQEPIITGIQWYSGFYVDSKERLVTNKTGNSVGHCIGGWKSVIVDGEQRIEFQNSYTNLPKFSLNRQQCQDLYFGYIALPIERPIVELILKYSGKMVKGSGPSIYLIQNGKKRHVTSENMMNLLGLTMRDFIDISDEDLSTIPDGDDLNLNDIKPAMVELVKRNNLTI